MRFERDLNLDSTGDDVRSLHAALLLLQLSVPHVERRAACFGAGTRELVCAFQRHCRIEPTGVVDSTTASAIGKAIDETRFTIGGTVARPDGSGVAGLRVEVVDKNVGADRRIAGAVTRESGQYHAHFAARALVGHHKGNPDLQVRVYAGDTLLATSAVHYNASRNETIDVTLPATAAALPSEYETLLAAVHAEHPGALASLVESEQQRDITYLANKTGWDARLIAVAAIAEQFARHVAIDPAFFYALFRAGAPTDAGLLYQIDASTAKQTWEAAIAGGVIPRTLSSAIAAAVAVFNGLVQTHALDVQNAGGLSTVKQLAQLSLGSDARKLQQFTQLYATHRSDWATFWTAARETLGDAATQRLQLDAHLGDLTIGNVPLIAKLHAAESLAEPVDLAARGYYSADKWRDLVAASPIPDDITGETVEAKRATYATMLAARVRVQFPTAVVAAQVRGGEIPLAAPAAREAVHQFLAEHQGRFEIARQPVEQYLVRNNIAGQVTPNVIEEIKRVQRVYQITTDDKSMIGLLERNVHSAYQIARLGEDEFVRGFQEHVGGEQSARTVWARARQLHNAVLNIASHYLVASTAPQVGVHSPGQIINQKPAPDDSTPDVIAYPTLEKLFGSLDYCSCDHCRSILSPAAYLVDLLHFLDRTPPTEQQVNPQDVLFARRPDIQHLKLSCENTNTPIPYIDIVNETLEYFVAHGDAHSPPALGDFSGNNTDDDARPDELLASPQYVDDAAYALLEQAIFPPPLPFNKPLETLRRYFKQFGVALHDAMTVLRATEDLERADPTSYGWRDILMERLQLSREEYRLLTVGTISVRHLYGFDQDDTNPAVPVDLTNVEKYSRRVGVSIADLITILQTRFINPSANLIARVEKLAVPFSVLADLHSGTLSASDLGKLLPTGLDPAAYGGTTPIADDGSNYADVMGQTIKTWLATADTYDRIMGIITIANPSDMNNLCAVDALEFRYANPDTNANQLKPIELVRLMRFIRLWRKLGWTIEQTDAAITALYPATQDLDAGFLVLLPRLGVVKEVLERLQLSVDRDLGGLLACWSPIGTNGPNSLYRRMFLSSALVERDPDFADDGFGTVLDDTKQHVINHVEALRAAFGMTSDEILLVAAALVDRANATQPPPNPALTKDTLPLTLDVVSAIYRHGWLARQLQLSVRELLLLEDVTGIDPFAPPDPPAPPIRALLDLVQRLGRSGVTPNSALYLIWDEDVSGKSGPDPRDIAQLAITLRGDFAAIDADFTIVNDPTGDVARSRMALVYGAEATDFFFGLLDNRFLVTASYAQPPDPQPLLTAAGGRLTYDEFAKQLTFAGYLDTNTKNGLTGAAGGIPALTQAVTDLDAAFELAVGPFFTRYPELRPLIETYASAPPTDSAEQKRTALLSAFLPTLKELRKREQALAALTAATRADLDLASVLLDDASALHAAASTAQPALADLTALETVPTDTITGAWKGFVNAPQNGDYELRVHLGTGVTGVTVTVDGTDLKMAAADPGTWKNGVALKLVAGRLSPFELTIAGAGTVRVDWITKGRGWVEIAAEYLYTADLIDHLQTTYTRFLKISTLASALKLTPGEVSYFARRTDLAIDPGGGARPWLDLLPVAAPITPAISHALADRLITLLDFAWLQAQLSPDDERLLEVVRAPEIAGPDGKPLLEALANWDADSLSAILKRFKKPRSGLSDIAVLTRVYDAFELVGRVGISGSALADATTNNPDPDSSTHVVRDFESALRGRYDAAAWLQVVTPINDELRVLRRDALVAYVLKQFARAGSPIDTADKLFEYFLMDVEMDACMKTSRIRHALSSVQLFIDRSLMNLERDVDSSLLPTAQWEWMRRYRVWEANRKVFLWPENWLDSTLLDRPSSMFKETLNELLQSDITEDSAEVALLNYLAKLEEVAKLEPCGVHYEDAKNVHVVARTAGSHRKYYYRRMQDGSWLPWEQIKLDIDDNPIVPYVWNGRLMLFWLKLVKMGPDTAQVPQPSSGNLRDVSKADIDKTAPTMTVHAVLSWSEYYNDKWQPPKTSNVDRPAVLWADIGPWMFNTAPGTSSSFDRSIVRMGIIPEGKALRISISSQSTANISLGFYFTSFLFHNTHSLPERAEDRPPAPFDVSNRRWFDTDSDKLTVHLINFTRVDPVILKREILQRLQPTAADTREPLHALHDWSTPFFYADSRHVFWVTPTSSTLNVTFTDPPTIPFGPDPRRWRDLYKEIDPIIRRVPGGDPARVRLSEDANIVNALARRDVVRFGQTAIAATGGVFATPSNVVS